MRIYLHWLLGYGPLLALALVLPRDLSHRLALGKVVLIFGGFVLACYPWLIWLEFGATLGNPPQPGAHLRYERVRDDWRQFTNGTLVWFGMPLLVTAVLNRLGFLG